MCTVDTYAKSTSTSETEDLVHSFQSKSHLLTAMCWVRKAKSLVTASNTPKILQSEHTEPCGTWCLHFFKKRAGCWLPSQQGGRQETQHLPWKPLPCHGCGKEFPLLWMGFTSFFSLCIRWHILEEGCRQRSTLMEWICKERPVRILGIMLLNYMRLRDKKACKLRRPSRGRVL